MAGERHPILVFLAAKKDRLTAAVPRTFAAALTWESVVQAVAIQLEDPKNKLRDCSPSSVYNSLLTILRLGLDPSPVRGQAYLVPYGGECQPIIGAQGKIELAYRSGLISKIVCQVVFADDDIEIDLANGQVIHRVTKEQLLAETDPGPAIAAYARVWIKGTDEPFTELMRRRDFLKIRASSKSKNSPAYANWEDEMFRRSCLNRALKRAPKSAELMEALKDVDLEQRDEADLTTISRDAIDADAAPALPDNGPAVNTDAAAIEREAAKRAAADVIDADTDVPFGDMP